NPRKAQLSRFSVADAGGAIRIASLKFAAVELYRHHLPPSRSLSVMRSLLAIAALFAAVGSGFAQEAKQPAKRPPNILYIMSDDHASAAIGAYGSWLGKFARTPNLDRLARSGMLFKNGLVSNSICTPARAAILTGQYSHKNGVYTLNDVMPTTTV